MNKHTLKWGIIGLGNIAHAFVQDLLLVNDTYIYACASRNIEKASAFSSKYAIKKAYGNYIDLINDEEVDIIYIATPHNSHMELSIKALEAGKYVLCKNLWRSINNKF